MNFFVCELRTGTMNSGGHTGVVHQLHLAFADDLLESFVQ